MNNDDRWESLINELALQVSINDLPWIKGELDIKEFVKRYKHEKE